MLQGGYKWGVAALLGVFGLSYLASHSGWGLPTGYSQAQSLGQGPTTRGSGSSGYYRGSSGGYYGRSFGRASVRSFGSSSSRGFSGGGYSGGK